MEYLAPCDSAKASANRLPPAGLSQLSWFVPCFSARCGCIALNCSPTTETERYASQVIVFYASFLQDAVGESFAFPSLDVLADYWLDKSSESGQRLRKVVN